MLNDSQDPILIFHMRTHVGGSLQPPVVSIFLLFHWPENNWKGKRKNALNLSTVSAACWFQQNRIGSVQTISVFLSRTCFCTQSSEGCCLTANSNCPQAIGSHFPAGSFIFQWKRKWSLALILNHPHATAYKVIRGGLCARTCTPVRKHPNGGGEKMESGRVRGEEMSVLLARADETVTAITG